MKSCPQCQRKYADEMEFCPQDGTPLISAMEETHVQLAAGLARRFRIVRRLGAGGMGTVYLAEQIGVGNRLVALKVLNRKLLDNPEFQMRFQNEAGSTGRIHHPNVVTIYEAAQADDGTPYIAMEYLDGETLRDELKQRGALPLGECANILRQIANGLNAAHRLGIIHRDLKPDNIFLTRGDGGEIQIKVVDFGIAKLRESVTHTMTGMVLGTPAYMSSEQAAGIRSDQLDLRSDVYSLGIVVYEMLTGSLPFHSDTPLGYLRKQMLEPPPPLRTFASGLPAPPAIEAAVMKSLAKDRTQRFKSALEFADEFSRAVSGVPPPETLRTTRIVEPGDWGQASLAQEKDAAAPGHPSLSTPAGGVHPSGQVEFTVPPIKTGPAPVVIPAPGEHKTPPPSLPRRTPPPLPHTTPPPIVIPGTAQSIGAGVPKSAWEVAPGIDRSIQASSSGMHAAARTPPPKFFKIGFWILGISVVFGILEGLIQLFSSNFHLGSGGVMGFLIELQVEIAFAAIYCLVLARRRITFLIWLAIVFAGLGMFFNLLFWVSVYELHSYSAIGTLLFLRGFFISTGLPLSSLLSPFLRTFGMRTFYYLVVVNLDSVAKIVFLILALIKYKEKPAIPLPSA